MLSVVGRPLNSLRVSGALTKATVAMADALAKIPDVEIDPEGTFKYILVRVKVKDGDVHKDIVRGTKSAEYHSKFVAVVCWRGASSCASSARDNAQTQMCAFAAEWADLTHCYDLAVHRANSDHNYCPDRAEGNTCQLYCTCLLHKRFAGYNA